MFAELDKTIEVLKNPDAGWVTRRDAAEALGKLAARAAQALRAHESDADRDVRDGIVRALGWVSTGLEGATLPADAMDYTLEGLVRGLAENEKNEVAPVKGGFEVRVALENERVQKVYISRHERKDGIKLFRISTRCGEPTEEGIPWALRNNGKLIQGALSLVEEDGKPLLVLVTNLIEGHVTPYEFALAVQEAAYYGDWVEQKFSERDDF